MIHDDKRRRRRDNRVRMIKRAVLALAALSVLLAGVVTVMYLTNTAPVVAVIPGAEAAAATKPYVIKLHAQWCPVCMMTKAMWSQIEAAYATRVNLVVFDFTNQTTTEASKIEAHRLGLDQFFDENVGWTGTIAVLNGQTKNVISTINGSRDFSEYRAAIDTALARRGP
jgi:thiol-disulfide isomerase/thioredoxin